MGVGLPHGLFEQLRYVFLLASVETVVANVLDLGLDIFVFVWAEDIVRLVFWSVLLFI